MKLTDYWHPFYLYLKLFTIAGLRGVIVSKRLPKSLMSLIEKSGLQLNNKDIAVHLKGYSHPIWLRYQSSDSCVLRQIFAQEEYACIRALDNPKLIVDCGANVGYSSLYFLTHYPTAHVIAIEPDPDNFRLCAKNLEPFRDRVTLLPSGVWSHPVGLRVCAGVYGDGLGWATQVRACSPDETPDIEAIDVSTLIAQSGADRIDLLKMDVERSEIEIFSQNYEGWLRKVDNIVIELHGEDCTQTFFQALSDYQYELSYSGELTVCQNIEPKPVLQNC